MLPLHKSPLLLFAVLISVLFLACEVSVARTPDGQKPNILFIFCDDLGYGDVGAFNEARHAQEKDQPFFTTPHIDELAREGIQLRAHYCGAPVCAPSRGTLFTGMSQGNAPIRNNQFDKAIPDQPTLGSVLQHNGYATALIGKWGLQGKGKSPKNWPAYPTRRGFDYFLGGVRHRDGHEHYPADNIHFSKAQNKKRFKKSWTEVWQQDEEIGAKLKGCYTTDLWTAGAKKWIIDHHNRTPEKPFFLFLSFDTPHAAPNSPAPLFPKGSAFMGESSGLEKKGK